MKKLYTLLCILVVPALLLAQEENMMLFPFKPLMEGVWKGEGKWKDGKPFKQEIAWSWGIGNQHVDYEVKSFLDTAGTSFGLAAKGTHSWDQKENKIRFWSFDVNGTVLEGIVKTKRKQLHYVYDYPMGDGTTVTLTEAWIWIKDDKYMNKIGVLEGEEWKEIYGEFYFWNK